MNLPEADSTAVCREEFLVLPGAGPLVLGDVSLTGGPAWGGPTSKVDHSETLTTLPSLYYSIHVAHSRSRWREIDYG